MSEDLKNNTDTYLDRVKQAKNVSAVLKLDFASFASVIPDNFIVFAYEGPSDKHLYYHWIKSIQPKLRYEAYICKNKSRALQLYDLLQSDQTGLGDRVYFFIDRDFDELQGRTSAKNIFVTDKYSIENYLVCSELLEDLLKVDFHCNGYPHIRTSVCNHFEELYSRFLDITRDLNLRIFASRTIPIKQIGDLPDKFNLLANVTLTNVSATEHSAQHLIRLSREPSEEEWAGVKIAFANIDPFNRYRGKFALQFLMKWLELLRQDRTANTSVLFPKMPKTDFTINGNFSLQTLAAKAPAPSKLSIFLAAV